MALADNKAKIQSLLAGINALPEAGSGEPTLQEKTVDPSTSAQSVTPDSGYDGLSKVTVNAVKTAVQGVPEITVSSTGEITAFVTQEEGYVEAGSRTAFKGLPVKGEQTITPGTADQIIESGNYLTGKQTIKGDAKLVPANIASGVSIFGVTGTLEAGGESGGSTGSVETCTLTIGENAGYPITYIGVDSSGKPCLYRNYTGVGELTVVKNTLLYTYGYGLDVDTSDEDACDVIRCVEYMADMFEEGLYVISVSGNAYIGFRNMEIIS